MNTTTATSQGAPQTARFKFHGEAGEFFGIWFVNNILTMLTLGFYGPWAKIRNLQYFYGNTELGGSSFQFTANPWALLRTRVIAMLLLLLYIFSENLSSTMAIAVFSCFIIGYFALAPVLMIFMLSFRTRYSVWRGVSFKFNRDYWGAYRVYLAPLSVLLLLAGSLAMPFYSENVEQITGLPHYEYAENEDEFEEPDSEISDTQTTTENETSFSDNNNLEFNNDITYDDNGYDEEYIEDEEDDLYVNPYLFIPFTFLSLIGLALLPYFDFINARFLIRNSRFGNSEFAFIATPKEYYVFYSKWYAVSLLLAGLWAGWFWLDDLGGLVFTGIILLSGFYFIGSRAYLKSRRTNILLNRTSLATHHRLSGYIPFWSLLWLMISNNVVVALTMGLMGPWAKVRVARFMLERAQLISTEPLNGFVTQQAHEASSLSEEIADAFDLDLV